MAGVNESIRDAMNGSALNTTNGSAINTTNGSVIEACAICWGSEMGYIGF